MNDIFDNSKSSVIIHYSCESFYRNEEDKLKTIENAIDEKSRKEAIQKPIAGKDDGTSARITSIAIRNLSDAQTVSFSVHQIAEEKGILFDEISEHYDDLEKTMLERYFQYIATRLHFNYIHWNMRDVAYGFAALEHRYRVHKGNPTLIPDEKKFDLARALITLYGINYIDHPRLEKILAYNNITMKDFLKGSEEAESWENKEFVKLHRSTLRKVDSMAGVFQRVIDKKLKVKTNWFQQNGYSIPVFIERFKQHWIFSSIVVIGGIIALFIKSNELVMMFK